MGEAKKTTKPKAKWGEVIDGVRQYPLHRYQAEILKSSARITFAFAGTGGGKTCLAPLWLIRQIERNGGKGRYLVVSPTYKVFKQSRLLDAFFEAVDGTALQGSFHKTDKIYTTGTGAEIFFRSADDPDSLEGGQYKALVLDEAAKLTHEAWIKASARVGAEQGPILGVTTPDVNSWIFTEVFKLCDGGELKINPDGAVRTSKDGKTKVVQWQSTVNPTYSKEELERQRHILPEAIFRRRYLGEFARLEGLVYETFAEAVIESSPDRLPSPAVRVVGGIDWGWSDPTSVVIGAECQNGTIYIVEELYESKLPLDQLTARLKKLKEKWGVEVFYCDHSRPEIKDQLKRYGLPVTNKKVSLIETGISMVDQRIRSGFLKVYMTCRNLIDEAARYQRKKQGEGEYSEKPVDKNNHLLDALRYLVTGLDFGRQLTFTAKLDAEHEDELAVKIRLGQRSTDPDERRRQEEAEAARLYNQRFYELAFGDLD